MRNDVYERIKYMKKDLDGITPNFAKIARTLECDYRTAKKLYYYDENSKPPIRKQRPSKLDQYKDMIITKLECNCKISSIYYFIKQKGYLGKYTILRDFCALYSKEKEQEATMRFETKPGLQAQVDWKESMSFITRDKKTLTINIFLMILGYSRTKYIELTLDKSQNTLFKCMINGFKYFGGVPHEIIFDNMKTVVDHSRSDFTNVVINERFKQFSKDVGFDIFTCRAYRPQTKGKVENLAKIMEWLRPYNNEIDSIEDLQEAVNKLRDDLFKEISRATNESPSTRLNKEKEYLHKLPSDDELQIYLNPNIQNRLVSKESLIVFDNKKYSVDPKYIDKTVEIKTDNNTLLIYYNKELIKSHEITNKPFNYSEDDYKAIIRASSANIENDEDIEKIAEQNLEIYDNL